MWHNKYMKGFNKTLFFFYLLTKYSVYPVFRENILLSGVGEVDSDLFHYRSKVMLSMLILWRHIDEVEVWIPTSRTLVLCGGEFSTTCPGHSTPGKNTSTHWVGEWVGWRGSLDILKNRKMSANAGILTPDCPTCSLVSFARYTMLINPSIIEAEVFNTKVL